MAEFDEKLNSILSNPDAMSQIMQLAQSLGGGEAASAPSAPPPQPGPPPAAGGGDLLSSLMGGGGMDPKLLSRLLPLLQELGSGENDQRTQLLQSLRPFLKESRQEKLDKAIQIARLLRVGKKFFGTLGET